MRKIFSFLMIAFLATALSACPKGLTQLQDSISHYDQATHAASTAETTFLNAVLTTDCENQFYNAAFCYSIWDEPEAKPYREELCASSIIRSRDTANISLREYCKPSIIDPQQIGIRNALMNAIVLYADKMQALASSGDDKDLDANSKTLAQNLNTIANTEGFKFKNPTIGQGVEAAVNEICKMAMDEVKYKDLQTAAKKMQPTLEKVVEALKEENKGLGSAMSQSLGYIEIILRTDITLSHKSHKSNAADVFFNIINARSILTSADLITKQSLTSQGTTTNSNDVDTAKPLNDMLDAIVSGNEAIANNKTGGIYAAANNLYKRAVEAKDLYSALATGK